MIAVDVRCGSGSGLFSTEAPNRFEMYRRMEQLSQRFGTAHWYEHVPGDFWDTLADDPDTGLRTAWSQWCVPETTKSRCTACLPMMSMSIGAKKQARWTRSTSWMPGWKQTTEEASLARRKPNTIGQMRTRPCWSSVAVTIAYPQKTRSPMSRGSRLSPDRPRAGCGFRCTCSGTAGVDRPGEPRLTYPSSRRRSAGRTAFVAKPPTSRRTTDLTDEITDPYGADSVHLRTSSAARSSRSAISA